MFEYLITSTSNNLILLIALFLITQYLALYRTVRHKAGIVSTKYQVYGPQNIIVGRKEKRLL